MKEIVGNKVLIVGYGVEGKSTHQFLLKNFPGVEIGIADHNQIEPVAPVALGVFTGSDYLSRLDRFDTVVHSPGVSPKVPELVNFKNAGNAVTSETNLFFSLVPGKVIGITGTKGKSTTSSLIFEILKSNFPDVRLTGNIGKPSLDYLEGSNSETIFVTELSSQQLEDAKYSPHIAVILNIFSEHLDAHGSFENYVLAKTNIVRHQTSEDFVVFNSENEIGAMMANTSSAKKVLFEEVDLQNKTKLPGPGNLENLRAAATVGKLMGVPKEKIEHALIDFKPLEHRLEFVGEVKKIKFYNDSLSTIPEALINALEALGSDVETIIAGGFDRGLNFSTLGQYLATKPNLKNLIIFPTTGAKIWKALEEAKIDKLPEKFPVTSMESAVKIAFERTPPGKICLLSPASPSFGIFKNYADRGNQFKKLVLEDKING